VATNSNLKVYHKDSNSEFASLLSKELEHSLKDNSIVNGIVEKIENSYVHIFIKGAKSSGSVEVSEIPHAELENLKVGSEIRCYIERLEDKAGNIILSIEKARRAESWKKIVEAFEKQEIVSGVIKNVVRGGFSVEHAGIVGFMPSSQLDTKPVKDVKHLIGKPLEMKIIKINSERLNLILSRRAILEEESNKQKDEVIKKYNVGDVISCKVKSCVSYGIFCSFEGIDALCHATELSWLKINNISDLFTVGETISAKIIEIDESNKRFSLSVRQLLPNPFETINKDYKVGEVYDGKIVKIMDFGVFCELKTGLVGLCHSSQIKWGAKNINPNSLFKVGEVIKVKLISVDAEKKKIELSHKDTLPNPLDDFLKTHPVGSIVKGKIVSKVEFGLFVNTGESDLDIFVHYRQCSYRNQTATVLNDFKKGDEVEVMITDTRDDKINGSISATTKNPFDFFKDKKVGDVITVRVKSIDKSLVKVDCGEQRYEAVIRKSELALEKADQRTERFSEGDHLDAKIIELDLEKLRVKLSVKALEQDQHDDALKKFGSTSSGQSLAGILGEALDKKDNKKD
jgi:small subunit ribosomal protein S1